MKNTVSDRSILDIIPLERIIRTIQDNNWENIYRVKTIDFEKCAIEKIEKTDSVLQSKQLTHFSRCNKRHRQHSIHSCDAISF